MKASLSRGTALTAALCVRGAQSITVVRVDPFKPKGGLEISDFRIFINPPSANPVPLEGWIEKPLVDTLAAASGKRVTRQCNAKRGDVDYLVVEIRRTYKLFASTPNLLITYRSGHKLGHVKAPFGIVVCPPWLLDDKRCGG